MAKRGVEHWWLRKLVKEATGYDPAQLSSAGDAAVLRVAIASYEGTCAHIRHDPTGEGYTPEQVKVNAKRKALWWWKGEGEL